MTAEGLPSFDLVVATVDRTDELSALLSSLERQTYAGFRVLLVDQNEDDRLTPVLREHGALDLTRLQTPRGLSRARNTALGHLHGDLVAFPDDDCVYPDDLLECIARRLAAEPGLDGLTGRSGEPTWASGGAILTRDNLWNRAISFTIFLRRDVVDHVGAFDEKLGLGAGSPWSSGEEIEYLVRAMDAGFRIEYDPSLRVMHDVKQLVPAALRAAGSRDGASVGYILRKHAYPATTVASKLARPAAGALIALARGDRARAGFHLATLRGRATAYRNARRFESK